MALSRILGRQDDLLRLYEDTKKLDAVDPLNDVEWFFVNVNIGEIDTALDHLERGIALGFPSGGIKFITQNSEHPFLEPVRDNPRFQAIIAKAKAKARN